jgi:hypothetical protein
MANYLDVAKEILLRIVEKVKEMCFPSNDDEPEPPSFSVITNLLRYAINYGFRLMLEGNENVMSNYSDYEFDIHTVRDLVSLCLPLHKEINEDQEEYFVSASCPDLWCGFCRRIGMNCQTFLLIRLIRMNVKCLPTLSTNQ